MRLFLFVRRTKVASVGRAVVFVVVVVVIVMFSFCCFSGDSYLL